MIFLDRTIGDDGLNWIGLVAPYDKPFFVAACACAATPTANTIIVITEIAGGNKSAMSTAIFVQYLVSPVLLTASLTMIVTVLTAYG